MESEEPQETSFQIEMHKDERSIVRSEAGSLIGIPLKIKTETVAVELFKFGRHLYHHL